MVVKKIGKTRGVKGRRKGLLIKYVRKKGTRAPGRREGFVETTVSEKKGD